jgi:hypothetical protein
LLCLANFWITLAWMPISPVDRTALPDLWSDAVGVIIGARRSGGGVAAQPTDFCLLCRSFHPEPLLLWRFALPFSESPRYRYAVKGQTLLVSAHICRHCRELDLPDRQPLSAIRELRKTRD